MTYCPRIYHGLVLDGIGRNSISFAACCWATKRTTDNNQINFNHPDLIKIRDQNQLGILPKDYCSRCIAQEKVGKHSMRQGYLETHGTETYESALQYLDINIDYTCNLACVTCGPTLSTTWRNELKIPGVDVRPDLDNFITTKLSNLDFSQLKEIRIWGGEPFLTNTHKIILNYIAQHHDPSQINLMYNTNGTRRIDQSTKELIEKFKFARISFSIDGIGLEFEYLRYPASWSEVEQNLYWWQENLPHNAMLSLTVTASLLNVLSLNSIFDWHQTNFTTSKFGDPIEIYVHQAFGTYGLEFMPNAMIEHLKSIDNFCQPWLQEIDILGTLNQNLYIVIDAIRTIDQRRGLDFSQVMPKTAKFIGYQK
jgi:sulfatase maturation enzyme AslB (radical SAM superfamily)